MVEVLKNESTDQRRFLIGKTPEFELAAFTLCALAQPQHPSRNDASNVITTKRCRFAVDKQNNEVDAVVSSASDADQNPRVLDIAWEFPKSSLSSNTDNSEYARHLSHDFPTVMDTVDEHPKHKKKKKHNNTGTNDPQLQGLVSQMWKLDQDDRVNNNSIVFNYGNHTDGNKDVSPNPFIVWVNESFFEKPMYAALIDIYNASLFHQPVCTAEGSMSDTRRAALENFLNVVTNTSTFQTAYDFLKSKNKTGSSYDEFYKKLFDLWFGTYSRCGGALGSSGWEHVFSGEYKNEIVDGHHSWIRYYLGEKAGEIDYHGYYSYVDGILGTIQYTWKGYLKKIGGFLLRSSPAFDFSLFTVCSLTHTGEEKCKFKIEGNDLFVTSFTQKCDAGYCLATSFPGMKS
ncbi:endoribonuclease xendoU domain-containing protein [Ditylenchus destructor]|uniref:Endoribonuclease xendoU domain-containing protein n=1 Tax=Ditylenchus destructor TaxID=166010 RepID=A0AAD4N818_9BILA|nr:endoribonuclease xendoU domain-containing protein [Ditylenchus destructor]